MTGKTHGMKVQTPDPVHEHLPSLKLQDTGHVGLAQTTHMRIYAHMHTRLGAGHERNVNSHSVGVAACVPVLDPLLCNGLSG